MPYSSIIVIEFKRPMRNNYNSEENPISQITNYITSLRGGKALDKNGRSVILLQNTPIFAYIICDLTPKARELLNQADYYQTPDTLGFFYYHKNLKAYIEVISLDKLLDDAKKRNKILFDKLNLL